MTVDFGKWASSFGIENNSTKDQFNCSRSCWFNFLPLYHMGLRATDPVASRINASYRLTNGLNQTEDFNGQEQRRSGGRTPRGRSHFLDSYVTWQANGRWTFAAEADHAVERPEAASPPRQVYGGAGFARFHVSPAFSLASRFAYLNDRDALFSSQAQALKDATATATFDLAEGFQMRWELRRDWSDRSFFLTSDPNRLKRSQTTALVGLIWWFGGKQGVWWRPVPPGIAPAGKGPTRALPPLAGLAISSVSFEYVPRRPAPHGIRMNPHRLLARAAVFRPTSIATDPAHPGRAPP